MNQLTKALVSELLDDKLVTAVYGGGFKPPTQGHLEVVQKALKQFPEIDKFIIYVGPGERNGISQEEAILIWEIYKNYLPLFVEIQPSSKGPIGDIMRYAKEHPDEVVYFVIGTRAGDEDDLKDVELRTKGVEEKYPNTRVKVIQTAGGGMSGTNARKAAKVSPEEFYKFLPPELNNKEKEEIFGYIQTVVTEDVSFEKKRELVKKIISMARKSGDLTSLDRLADMIAAKITIDIPQKPKSGEFKVIGGKPFVEQINEHSMDNSIDLLPLLAKLTQHMIDKGHKIKPLPGLELIDDDVENAEDFFGKTAYYDPNEQMIVLYTHGRHPKDIARSYAHEMIHHEQNLEDRLGPITTTNTQEDDHLNDIEAEANLKGTMTFRNWTDSVQENKDPFGLLDGLLNEGVYDSIVSKLAKDVTDNWVMQFKEDPKRLFALLDTNYELEDAKGRPLEFDLLAKLDFKKTKDRTYKVDGGANEGDDESEGFIALNFSVDPRELPRMWSTIAMDIRDVLRHEIEHLTQGGWNERSGKYMEDDSQIRDLINKYKLLAPKNYFLLDKEVDAMLQGMYFKAKKSRRPFADVIEGYLDMVGLEPEEKEEIKTRWRGRLKALSLPVFETKYRLKKVMNEQEGEQKYKIYCDMDGVICDFDKRFEQVSGGISPRQYEDQNGKEAFWDLIDNQTGVKFWVGMPWMPNGKQLWDYIKKYTPTLLSAPSRQNESRLGKRLWVRNNIPGTKLILASAQNKQNYSGTNRILIDDRPSNIEQWKSAGGIGILFISTEQTIKELQKLGL